jgi:DMSO/TMAO reductase YedYZ molybdopterin-dependent catalytic subunit
VPDPYAGWSRGRGLALGTTLGLITAGVSVGVAQLVAGIVDPQASPIIAVCQAAIDATPEWLKGFAIRTFGSSDKQVLLGGIGAGLVAIAIVLGSASIRRPRVGVIGLVAFGLVGSAATSRPVSELADALPSIAGAAAGVGTLLVLRRSLIPASSEAIPRVADGGGWGTFDRRRFLMTAVGGVVVAAASGGLGNLLSRRSRADGSRAAVRIPPPASLAPAATGTELDVAGLGPFLTPNDSFYRVDTALLVPALMAEDWRLRIHGMVDREIVLGYEQLVSRPLIERDITLTCVSNPVGGHYAGNARWIGAPLRDLLEEVGVRPGADQIVTRSVDGFTVGTPTAVVMDGRDAMLAVAMNGEALPLPHGFPVRMIVPGLYGYVSATKWVTDMELTTFDAFDPYWVQRGWAERAPIKTMSRIDTPTSYARIHPGEVPVAGVAWAQHVGIERVEVQVDDEPWIEAALAGEDSVDTWRQWVYRWDARLGEHRVRVRATDRTGATQTPDRAEPFPDGATGHHTIVVRLE